VDRLDPGVVAGAARLRDDPSLDILDDEADPAITIERGEDRAEPLGGQGLAADDLARDDLAGTDRQRPLVAAQRAPLRTPRWRRRATRG
jgi:hypothetical protein